MSNDFEYFHVHFYENISTTINSPYIHKIKKLEVNSGEEINR